MSLTSTSTVRDFSHLKVKISHRTVNPLTEYKYFIIRQFPQGENYRKVEIFHHKVRKIGANSRTMRNFDVTVRKISLRTGILVLACQ
jgi:hypothetical protein